MQISVVLPPLPKPEFEQMRSESSTGVSVVVCLVTTFVALTFAFSHGMPTEKRTFYVRAILAEAALALVCLAYLMFGDPGVIRRTARSCLVRA